MTHKLFFLSLFIFGFSAGISAQTEKPASMPCIRGYWEIRPGISYFFDGEGHGDLFMGDESDSGMGFTYTCDTTVQHLSRVHMHFEDHVTFDVCFVCEPGEENELIVYMLKDTRQCPERINSPGITEVIWTRPTFKKE